MNKQKSSGPTPEDGSEEDLENPGFFSEFAEFLTHNKKWWLVPLILILFLIGGLLALAGQNAAIAPFIYTLF